ncbi:collagen alpha-1(I) chain-like isoform X2 [Canis lupus familiaris]|uniref:collagen alpha-1(I) chain-like isoform X2 n=1 Tax=Canis lupus familiaris TaxID=9615 RepID=UPI0018F69A9D|nr:collagen alpha-1(I) chain-like isoform X2 [Canis lupus familiaris]
MNIFFKKKTPNFTGRRQKGRAASVSSHAQAGSRPGLVSPVVASCRPLGRVRWAHGADSDPLPHVPQELAPLAEDPCPRPPAKRPAVTPPLPRAPLRRLLCGAPGAVGARAGPGLAPGGGRRAAEPSSRAGRLGSACSLPPQPRVPRWERGGPPGRPRGRRGPRVPRVPGRSAAAASGPPGPAQGVRPAGRQAPPAASAPPRASQLRRLRRSRGLGVSGLAAERPPCPRPAPPLLCFGCPELAAPAPAPAPLTSASPLCCCGGASGAEGGCGLPSRERSVPPEGPTAAAAWAAGAAAGRGRPRGGAGAGAGTRLSGPPLEGGRPPARPRREAPARRALGPRAVAARPAALPGGAGGGHGAALPGCAGRPGRPAGAGSACPHAGAPRPQLPRRRDPDPGRQRAAAVRRDEDQSASPGLAGSLASSPKGPGVQRPRAHTEPLGKDGTRAARPSRAPRSAPDPPGPAAPLGAHLAGPSGGGKVSARSLIWTTGAAGGAGTPGRGGPTRAAAIPSHGTCQRHPRRAPALKEPPAPPRLLRSFRQRCPAPRRGGAHRPLQGTGAAAPAEGETGFPHRPLSPEVTCAHLLTDGPLHRGPRPCGRTREPGRFPTLLWPRATPPPPPPPAPSSLRTLGREEDEGHQHRARPDARAALSPGAPGRPQGQPRPGTRGHEAAGPRTCSSGRNHAGPPFPLLAIPATPRGKPKGLRNKEILVTLTTEIHQGNRALKSLVRRNPLLEKNRANRKEFSQ